MKHLTDEQLSAYLDGATKGRDAVEAERHLDACQPCREALAEMAAQDQSLRPALTHDPGDEYFETFAARVGDRIRAAGLAGAATHTDEFDLWRLFRSPRVLAWTGAVAVLVVGGGLALMTSREVLPPTLRDRDADRFMSRSAPPPTSPSTAPPSAPPTSPSPEAASSEATPAPTEPLKEQHQLSKNHASGARVFAREQGSAPGGKQELKSSGAPAPPSADERMAAPTRAMEVRRTESGEEVAVRKDMPAPAPAPARVSTWGSVKAESLLVRKKTTAEPMQAQATAPRPISSSDATSRQELAQNPSFAQPAPSAARAAGADLRVCGEVRDPQGRPIANAQVAASDLGRTASTDTQGHFCLSLPAGEHPLTVMAVGYAPLRRTVRTGEPDQQLMLAAVPVLENERAAWGKLKSETLAYREADNQRASLPDSVRAMMQTAARLETDAAARRSASQYDAAAAAWERTLPAVAGSTLEVETRRHLATARYRAWELAPTQARARSAFEALSAYVDRAPAGPERAQATAWRDRVKP